MVGTGAWPLGHTLVPAEEWRHHINFPRVLIAVESAFGVQQGGPCFRLSLFCQITEFELGTLIRKKHSIKK